MEAVITLLPGDGIGPEVIASARRVLDVVADRYGHDFVFHEALIGGAAIEATGDPLPKETVDLCETATAVLLGAVGGPQWSDPNAKIRPEQGLLKIRAALGVYANIRPVTVYAELADASPLKAEKLRGVDMLVVRELTGGIYFGKKTRTTTTASDLCTYSVGEIERIVRVASRLAQDRRGKLCSVDKANVLETSRLWRDVTDRLVASEFPNIELETLLVDAAAMHLLSRPADFDVIVTENMFGDILTDEASMLAGSLGMLPSASLGDGNVGLYGHRRPRPRQPLRNGRELRDDAPLQPRAGGGSCRGRAGYRDSHCRGSQNRRYCDRGRQRDLDLGDDGRNYSFLELTT